MKIDRTAYQSYLLRLWCEKEGDGWRASVENVATHSCRNFPDMISLFVFLYEQTIQSTSGMEFGEFTLPESSKSQTPIYVEYIEEEASD
jgi:hypothetical protein